jgi:hypothetical protein
VGHRTTTIPTKQNVAIYATTLPLARPATAVTCRCARSTTVVRVALVWTPPAKPTRSMRMPEVKGD